MNILEITRTVAEVIGGITLLFIIIKQNYLISLFKDRKQEDQLLIIIKNQTVIMAKLEDFQTQAARIDAATQNISAYVTGSGMTAAEQDEALKTVTGAVDKLTAAVPVQPGEQSAQS